MDIFGWISAIFYKADNFCEFLFAFRKGVISKRNAILEWCGYVGVKHLSEQLLTLVLLNPDMPCIFKL